MDNAREEPTADAAQNDQSNAQDHFDLIIRKHLILLPETEEIPRDRRLLEMGVDSMRSIDLLLDLERTFQVTFPDEMLNAETFRTVATLERAVRTLLRA